ncbi:MAG: ABC transporter ATP-binding protein [Vulcanimicrobiota bacterium]
MLARLLSFQGRGATLLLVCLMACNACFEVLSVLTVYPIGALASEPGLLTSNSSLARLHVWLGQPPTQTMVLYFCALFVACFVLNTLSNALTLWLQQRYTLALRHRLASRLLRGYLNREHAWLLLHHTGQLAKNVLSECDRLCEEVVARLITVGVRGLTALLICLTLLWLNPWVAIGCSLSLLLTYRQIYRFFRVRLDRMGKLRVQLNQERHTHALESLSALKEARLGSQAARLHLDFERASQQQAGLDLRHRMVAEMPRYLTEILAIGVLVGVFAYLVSLGRDPRQAFPWIGLYIMAIWRLVPALQEVYGCLVDIRLNWPLLQQFEEALAWPLGEQPLTPQPLLRELSLESVSYRYPGAEREAVHNLTLKLERHRMLALVGKTGSGKTTVADILAGQLVPQSGRVLVDGLPLRPKNWQANVGYVPQSIYLSSASLRRNIALGVPEAEIDEQRLLQVARVAQLEGLIEQLPEGLDTLLGERGFSLSGGERQRVGIARALYHEPEVLIFDEATSALDNQTEAGVMEAIESLASAHTIILIAHRLSTVRNCQTVCFFEDGRMLAQGSYAELLEDCQPFRALHNQD